MLKFSVPAADGSDVPYQYPHTFEVQAGRGSGRLVVAPRADHVALLLDLAATWRAPEYYLLYVLVVTRLGSVEARYESPEALGFEQLSNFLHRFKPYLESDGRHHLWLASPAGEGTLVLDRHGVIYAYGSIEAYRVVLLRHGLSEGPVSVPVPHSHHYHAENDRFEQELLDHVSWIVKPLRAEDTV